MTEKLFTNKNEKRHIEVAYMLLESGLPIEIGS